MARRSGLHLTLIICAFSGSTFGKDHDLPTTFTKCSRDDPQLGNCLMHAVTNALPEMKGGIPALGVPPIDPLHISALTIQQGRNSPINLKQEFKNIALTGISSTKLVTYKPDLDHYILRTEGISPRVNLAGEYTMTGRILLLPIVGHGRANITMINLKTVHELIGEPIKKHGEVFIRFKEYNVKLIPARVYLNFENLFNGDRLLGNQMNRFMNDNWELIFNELKGGYEETLSYVFKEVTNKLFTKVPMDRIFPRTVKENESEAPLPPTPVKTDSTKAQTEVTN